MRLADFQLRAIAELKDKMAEPDLHNIVLKSPTGSGKTIILTHFMDEYHSENACVVFVWFTPGKGDLEEQSKEKMDRYIRNAQTKLLADVMTSGFAECDSVFINWEKLNKKGNNALKDSERTNFIEWIEKARMAGLQFTLIIDESHTNDTIKTEEIVSLFHADKVIRCSATPKNYSANELVEVTDEEVIEAGLIKKMIAINMELPDAVNLVQGQTETSYLLDFAIKKRNEIDSEFARRSVDVNPLVVVQLPDNDDTLIEEVEAYLDTKGINYGNGTLAIWTAKRKQNTEGISENNAKVQFVIIKQAIAMGWDCPRAHILVKLRKNMGDTFEIQTIGRIRRMPEAKHYNCDLLDYCYIYTLDTKFKQGLVSNMGKDALKAETLYLKKEYKKFQLMGEHRTMVTDTRDARLCRESILKYFIDKYKLEVGDFEYNLKKLKSADFVFETKIINQTVKGAAEQISESMTKEMDPIYFYTEFETMHGRMGREFHNRLGKIGAEIGLPYTEIGDILGYLFCSKFKNGTVSKLLNLDPKEFYTFIINNFDLLRCIVREAMASHYAGGSPVPGGNPVSTFTYKFPLICIHTYNERSRVQTVAKKNVYEGYRMSAEPRSKGEKLFEKYLESNANVDFWCKNGDKGEDFFSIVYYDNSNRQKLFFPDYIVCVKGAIWIIETKGGFSKSGKSQDIDKYSAKKFDALKAYCENYELQGGFVRYDEDEQELCIATEEYSDDIKDKERWKLLREVLGGDSVRGWQVEEDEEFQKSWSKLRDDDEDPQVKEYDESHPICGGKLIDRTQWTFENGVHEFSFMKECTCDKCGRKFKLYYPAGIRICKKCGQTFTLCPNCDSGYHDFYAHADSAMPMKDGHLPTFQDVLEDDIRRNYGEHADEVLRSMEEGRKRAEKLNATSESKPISDMDEIRLKAILGYCKQGNYLSAQAFYRAFSYDPDRKQLADKWLQERGVDLSKSRD